MSRSLNKALLIGNVGADPEVRTTASGARVATFRLATSQRAPARETVGAERTEWHQVVVWGELIAIVERFIHKGDRVFVDGRIEHRSWKDRSGRPRHFTEIVAEDLILLSGQDAPHSALSTAPRERWTSDSTGNDGEEAPF